MDTIELGDKVHDYVSGFTGKVTGYTRFITGSDRATVTSETLDSNGRPVEEWFDVERLRVDEAATIAPGA